MPLRTTPTSQQTSKSSGSQETTLQAQTQRKYPYGKLQEQSTTIIKQHRVNGSWFKVTNSGMGPTLTGGGLLWLIGGYTISDTGTYYTYYDRGDINLKIVVASAAVLT